MIQLHVMSPLTFIFRLFPGDRKCSSRESHFLPRSRGGPPSAMNIDRHGVIFKKEHGGGRRFTLNVAMEISDILSLRCFFSLEVAKPAKIRSDRCFPLQTLRLGEIIKAHYTILDFLNTAP